MWEYIIIIQIDSHANCRLCGMTKVLSFMITNEQDYPPHHFVVPPAMGGELLVMIPENKIPRLNGVACECKTGSVE